MMSARAEERREQRFASRQAGGVVSLVILRLLVGLAIFTVTTGGPAYSQVPAAAPSPLCPGCGLPPGLLEDLDNPSEQDQGKEQFCGDDAISKVVCQIPADKARTWSIQFCDWFRVNKDNFPPNVSIPIGPIRVSRADAEWYCRRFFPPS